VEAWTAATDGTRLWYEELNDALDIVDETPSVLFAAGALTWTVI
jgi:hypothetical protein